MNDLISKQAVLDYCEDLKHYKFLSRKNLVEFLEELPVTEERRTAKWIDGICSRCAYMGDVEIFKGEFKYCPVCGSEMVDRIDG